MSKAISLVKKSVPKAAKKGIPILNVTEVVREMSAAAKEYAIVCKQEDTKRAAIQSERDAQRERIRAQKEILLKALDDVCTERTMTLEKQFEVIDKALEEGNLEMLQVGLGSVVRVIESSPIANFQAFSATFKDETKEIEI